MPVRHGSLSVIPAVEGGDRGLWSKWGQHFSNLWGWLWNPTTKNEIEVPSRKIPNFGLGPLYSSPLTYFSSQKYTRKGEERKNKWKKEGMKEMEKREREKERGKRGKERGLEWEWKNKWQGTKAPIWVRPLGQNQRNFSREIQGWKHPLPALTIRPRKQSFPLHPV